MDRRLQMVFLNSAGRNVSISVADCRSDLQEAEVDALMNNIYNANVFDTTGGEIVGMVRAQVISREVDTIKEF